MMSSISICDIKSTFNIVIVDEWMDRWMDEWMDGWMEGGRVDM